MAVARDPAVTSTGNDDRNQLKSRLSSYRQKEVRFNPKKIQPDAPLSKNGLSPHGAVPGFCSANRHSSSWLVNFGTAPDGSGDSPKFTATRLIKNVHMLGGRNILNKAYR